MKLSVEQMDCLIQINRETVEGNIMSAMLEPNAEQIKDEKLYAKWECQTKNLNW